MSVIEKPWGELIVNDDTGEDARPEIKRKVEGEIYAECGSRTASAVDRLTRQPGDRYLAEERWS